MDKEETSASTETANKIITDNYNGSNRQNIKDSSDKPSADVVTKPSHGGGLISVTQQSNISGTSGNTSSSSSATVKAKSYGDQHEKRIGANYNLKMQIENLPESGIELLGSVTFSPFGGPDCGHAVRTSARVIQKMRMDTARPSTPPPPDKKEKQKEETSLPKTPNQPKFNRIMWSNTERNLFFEALNEYGKDFESICHYMNHKMKRKLPTDLSYKSKEQIRQLYCQTFHKISKFLKFSDDVKKVAQELYGLINYGEMRRKLIFVHEKACMKLRELVYKGSVIIREKGKNIRIKTPSCRALRKLNQLEEWQEEIKLPQRVEVNLKPANMDAWGRVQNLAQNPRLKATLPLQKRVSSLLKFLQYKWRSQEIRLCEKTMTIQPSLSVNVNSNLIPPNNTIGHHKNQHQAKGTKHHNHIQQQQVQQQQYNNMETVVISPDIAANEMFLCFAPPHKTIIHRPMVNLTEFSNSYSICLNSYEERIGARVRGETLCSEKIQNLKEVMKSNKRQRHDSGSDKKSPDLKKNKNEAGITESMIKTITEVTEGNSDNVVMKSENVINQGNISETTTINDDIKIIDFSTFVSGNEEKYCSSLMGIEKLEVFSDNSQDKKEKLYEGKLDLEETLQNSQSTRIEPETNFSKIDNDFKSNVNTKSLIQMDDSIKIIKKRDSKCNQNNRKESYRNQSKSFKPLISEDVIRKIKKGWTLSNVGDLTFGDLYVMFGRDFKITLEYRWVPSAILQPNASLPMPSTLAIMEDSAKTDGSSITTSIEITTDYRITSSDGDLITEKTENKLKILDERSVPQKTERSEEKILGRKLSQLLTIASMMEKGKKRTSCSCGHICDKGFKLRDGEVSNKLYPSAYMMSDGNVFKHPAIPVRNPAETFRYLSSIRTNKQQRWLRARNQHSTFPSKQVVVQRLLPLQPGMKQSYDVVATNVDYLNETNTSETLDASKKCEKIKLITKEHTEKELNDENDVNIEEEKIIGDVHEISTDTDEDDDNLDIDNDPGIRSLMDISLPSIRFGDGDESRLGDGFLPVGTTPPMSPMRLIRDQNDGNDSKWLEENMNDYSFSSLLGHLDSHYDAGKKTSGRSNHDDSSIMSETSIDYINKFAEMAELLAQGSSHS